MKTFRLTLALVVLAAFVSHSTYAQVDPVEDSVTTPVGLDTTLTGLAVDSLPSVDTVYFQPDPLESESAQVTNPVDFEKHLSQKPTIALFKSMFVPGWGQLGNRSYVKAGLIIGLESWLLSTAIHYGSKASDAKDRYEMAVEPLERDRRYGEYEDWRSLRNKYTWLAGLTIFISMFDAYVDAHLSGAPDTDRNSRIHFKVRPKESGGAEASLSIRF